MNTYKHGIYMFNNKHSDESEHICLLIYIKCDHDQLLRSLPISYNKNNGDHTFLDILIFCFKIAFKNIFGKVFY